jgi:hypothetical protein
MKNIPLLLSSAALLLLAACDDDNNNGRNHSGPGTPSTVSGLAVSLINTGTCNDAEPVQVNGAVISDDDTLTDVTTLTPACSP